MFFPIIQSGELPVVDMDSMENEVETDMPIITPPSAMGNTELSLSKFLSRPRQVNIISLTTSTAVNTTFRFYPLQRLFAEAAVIDKIKNYSLMRATICFRVKANTAKTNYQTWLFSMRPTPVNGAGDVRETFGAPTAGIATSTSDVSNSRLDILYSQRPGFTLQLGVDNDITYKMPYCHYQEWWPITRSSPTTYWEICYRALTSLRSANEQVPTGTFQFYVWLEDVELAGSSVAPIVQSRDEYGVGAISRPASIVANIGQRLETVPIIGPFALATKIGASAVSSIAKLFGYTNVPVISDAQPVTVAAMPPLATDLIGFNFEKLTSDPKAETTISGADVGFTPDDELAISSFLSHKSIFATATWGLSDGSNLDLLAIRINPTISSATFTANTGTIYHTPLSLLSNFYQYWRGDIELHVHINASPLHNGSIAIYYDPTGNGSTNLSNTVDPFGDVATRVIDLASGERDVVITIPYTSEYMWKRLTPWYTNGDRPSFYTRPTGGNYTTLLANYVDTLDTGLVVFRTLSTLTTMSDSNADVELICWIKAGKNFQFSSPAALDNADNFLAPSGFQSTEPVVQSLDVIGGETDEPSDMACNGVYMGEVHKSLRSLMRRVNLQTTYDFNVASDRPNWMYSVPLPVSPLMPGFSTTGNTTARYLLAANSGKFNDWHIAPLQLIESCFTGRRGSYNWSAVVTALNVTLLAHVRRASPSDNNYTPHYTYGVINGLSNAGFLADGKNISYRYRLGTTGGASVTSVSDRATLNWVLPFKTNWRYVAANPSFAYPGSHSLHSELSLKTSNTNYANGGSAITADIFCGIGVDYSLHGFMNVPRMSIYLTHPAIEGADLTFVT